jgi:hypothetical protein
MAQLNVNLDDEQLRSLRRYAARRRTPVSWLIKDYVDYLLSGGTPVTSPVEDEVSATDLAILAERGGAFDWLGDEPDVYTPDDGEPL